MLTPPLQREKHSRISSFTLFPQTVDDPPYSESESSYYLSRNVSIFGNTDFLDNEQSLFWRNQSVIDKINGLKDYFEFTNPDTIQNFLLDNPELIGFLHESVAYITESYNSTALSLNLHTDPEEGWDELFVEIRVPLSPDKVIQCENTFLDNWFLERMDNVNGKLNFLWDVSDEFQME